MCALGVMASSGGQVVRFSDVRSFLSASPAPVSPSSDPTASLSPSPSSSPGVSASPSTSAPVVSCAWTPEAVNGVVFALVLLVFLVAAGVVGRWGRG